MKTKNIIKDKLTEILKKQNKILDTEVFEVVLYQVNIHDEPYDDEMIDNVRDVYTDLIYKKVYWAHRTTITP
jgi:hypothetical protein